MIFLIRVVLILEETILLDTIVSISIKPTNFKQIVEILTKFLILNRFSVNILD